MTSSFSFFCFLMITFEPLITVQNGSNIGKSLSRSIRRRTFGLDIFIIKEMVTDWKFENLTLASDFCQFLADNFGTSHHSAKMEDTIGKSFSRSIRRRTFGLDIFIIKRKWWQIEILKIWLWLQIFVGFWPITLEPLITVQKWKIPSQRSSHDLSDADNLVLISSLLRKWRQIEIVENLTSSFSFVLFSDDNFGTAHHSAKWK